MLLFIRSPSKDRIVAPEFQYISCYSLSATLVTDTANAIEFQYISCYSLSNRYEWEYSPDELFQYISCYSLSAELLATKKAKEVFQYISCYSLSESYNLETYQSVSVSIHLMLLFISIRSVRVRCHNGVSIHLMLLFIFAGTTNNDRFLTFQYISCYSLSMGMRLIDADKIMFQYISCYSLSKAARYAFGSLRSFNTSHVTLYRKLLLKQYFDSRFQYISCYSLSSTTHNLISSLNVSIHLMLLFIDILLY